MFELLLSTGAMANPRRKWEIMGQMTSPTRRPATVIIGEDAYVFGGSVTLPTADSYSNKFTKYNLRTKAVTVMPTGPEGRNGAKIAVWGSKIYIYGGFSTGPVLADFWVFDTNTNLWTKLPQFLTGAGSSGESMTAYNGYIYVAGGSGAAGACWRFDTSSPTSAWVKMQSVPGTNMSAGAFVTLGSMLYYIGGKSGATATNTIYGYNPATGTWGTVTTLPKVQSDVFGTVMNGIAYLYCNNPDDMYTFNGTNALPLEQSQKLTKTLLDVGFVSRDNTLYTFGGFSLTAPTGITGDIWEFKM